VVTLRKIAALAALALKDMGLIMSFRAQRGIPRAGENHPLPASPKIVNDFGGGADDALRGMSAPADVRSKGHAMICV